MLLPDCRHSGNNPESYTTVVLWVKCVPCAKNGLHLSSPAGFRAPSYQVMAPRTCSIASGPCLESHCFQLSSSTHPYPGILLFPCATTVLQGRGRGSHDDSTPRVCPYGHTTRPPTGCSFSRPSAGAGQTCAAAPLPTDCGRLFAMSSSGSLRVDRCCSTRVSRTYRQIIEPTPTPLSRGEIMGPFPLALPN